MQALPRYKKGTSYNILEHLFAGPSVFEVYIPEAPPAGKVNVPMVVIVSGLTGLAWSLYAPH